MLFTLYKTTNLINNKIYIGVHKTLDPYDDYLGSGFRLKLAVKKYGTSNFKKEIITIFETEQAAYETESNLVDDTFLKRSDVYNIKNGGAGGNISPNIGTRKKRITLTETHKNNIATKISSKVWLYNKITKDTQRVNKSKMQYYLDNGYVIGRPPLSNEHKEKLKSQKNIKKEIVTCPHCNKSGGKPVMNRYHFDNCKMVSE